MRQDWAHSASAKTCVGPPVDFTWRHFHRQLDVASFGLSTALNLGGNLFKKKKMRGSALFLAPLFSSESTMAHVGCFVL
jgi:hypothetical protein